MSKRDTPEKGPPKGGEGAEEPRPDSAAASGPVPTLEAERLYRQIIEERLPEARIGRVRRCVMAITADPYAVDEVENDLKLRVGPERVNHFETPG